MQNYTREYQYDKNNNLKQIKQTAGNTFTRNITISDTSNRGVISTLTEDPTAVDSFFDANGNLTELEHLQEIGWNYRDNISKAVKGSDTEYYIYDASGNRVRKISVFSTGEEREVIYLGGVEVKRIHQGANVILERYDHHVMDDTSRIAIVNRWRIDTQRRENNTVINSGDPEVFKIRYQYGNHLGSASLELDGSGDFVSYQEYFPYGGTSYTVGEVSTEYRFTGKEMDDFTGLYYFGARYYISWIGRWMSADPKRENEDGLNLYVYVRGNPVTLVDPNGMQGKFIFKPQFLTKEQILNHALKNPQSKIELLKNEELLNAVLEKAQTPKPTILERIINTSKVVGKASVYATSAVALDKVLVGPGVENEINGGMSERLLNKSEVFGSSEYEYKYGKPSTENAPANVLKNKSISLKSNVNLINIGSGYFTEDAKNTEVSNLYPASLSSSEILRRELKAAGVPTPPYKNAAHHIIPEKDPRALEARNILEDFGIDLNSAINGVFLPMEDGQYVEDEAKHIGNHSPEYIEEVTSRLETVVNKGGNKEDVVEALSGIREDLLQGKIKLN